MRWVDWFWKGRNLPLQPNSGANHPKNYKNKRLKQTKPAGQKPPHKRVPALMSECAVASPTSAFQLWIGQPIETLKCTQTWCAMKEDPKK